MTIRKIWLFVLMFVAVISIGINAVVLTSLTDKYFKNYLADNYEMHISKILEYTKNALISKELSFKQMNIELETHLDDPIVHIKLYNPKGELLIDVKHDYDIRGNMQHGKMMSNMRNSGQEEVEQYNITNLGTTLGYLNVTRNSSTDQSIVARMFKSALFMNSLFSMVIALVFSIIIGIFVSKGMSRALRDTAKLAGDVQVGLSEKYKKSDILEIKQIRDSLEDLDIRLRLKQKSRKALVDQLIHETRTPLTILKSHLEAIEDGVIEVNSDELGICQNQIESITSIISNLSGMIDAKKEENIITTEEFELSHLLKQIMIGLKTQFDKKGIQLKLIQNEKVKMKTDKYKLSQVIYNVLTNAYKYTEKMGSVSISYTKKENKVIVEIQDTGIGIKDEDLERIFDAYYRSEAVSQVKGEGIGLFVVKENLELINGSIAVQSEKGIGSTFTIQLPIY